MLREPPGDVVALADVHHRIKRFVRVFTPQDVDPWRMQSFTGGQCQIRSSKHHSLTRPVGFLHNSNPGRVAGRDKNLDHIRLAHVQTLSRFALEQDSGPLASCPTTLFSRAADPATEVVGVIELLLSVTGDSWWGEIDTQVFENSRVVHTGEVFDEVVLAGLSEHQPVHGD